MSWTLQNKRALVTGGTRGIGLAIVEELASLGSIVIFTGRREQDVRLAEDNLLARGYRVSGVVSDVTNESSRRHTLDWLKTDGDRLDILVNNAGTNIRKPLQDYRAEDFAHVFDTNMSATLAWTRELHPLLRSAGGASVINITSVAGSVDAGAGAAYSMSKAAVIQMTRVLANAWARDGIRVNAVAPWFTETDLTRQVLADASKRAGIEQLTALGRTARPEEIAAVVAFLALDKSSYVTGQNWLVDGGLSSRAIPA